MAFKCLHGKGPAYLTELLTPYKPARSLRSEASNLLVVPTTHYVKTAQRAFGVRAPQEWNNLPQSLRDKPSIDSFRKGLKTFLFKVAYSDN